MSEEKMFGKKVQQNVWKKKSLKNVKKKLVGRKEV